MAKRLAELGALQDAVSNDESSPKRLALAGYIRGLFLDWSANPYNPLSRLTARGRLLGYFWDSGAIGLSMNFADQNYLVKDGTVQSKSFSQIVNFSRTTNATVTNSAGQITYAPHNLLTFSEQFDNAAWTKTNITVTANAVAAPDGTTTADKIEATTSATTTLVRTYAATISSAHTLSIYVKKGSGATDANKFNLRNSTTATNVSQFTFNYDTGVITHIAGSGATATDAGNGWWRIVAPMATGISSGDSLSLNLIFQGSSETANEFAYAWGVQLEIGSTATTYNPTTVKNLLGYSELFDNAAWTKSNSFVQTNLLTYSEAFDNAAWVKGTGGVGSAPVVTANSVIAPNGYQTADTVVLDLNGGTTSADLSWLYQNYSVTTGLVYTFSIYVKATTANDVGKQVRAGGIAYTDIVTLTASWQRVTITATALSTGTVSFGFRLRGNEITNDVSIDVWGAQLVQGSVAGDYRRTDAAALPVYYPNHNGVVCAEQLHGTAANGTILESYTASGAPMTFSVWMRRITGTGNVDITMDTGVTWTTQAITTSWARYSITSTPASGARTAGIRLVTSGDVIQVFGGQVSPSASLDTYVLNAAAAPTAAAYYGARFDYDPVTLLPKGLLIEEQRSNLLVNSSILGTLLSTQSVTVAAVAHTLSFYGTGTVTITGIYVGSLVGSGAYPTRSTLTFTPTAGVILLTVTGNVQFAQLEIGTFATSFIPTAASQVTRATDVATIQGSNFYSWYNQNEGSAKTSAYVYKSDPATAQYPYSFTENATNNMIFTAVSANAISFNINTGGAAQVAILTTPISANTLFNICSAYKLNDSASVLNNGTVGTDAIVITPLVDRLILGNRSDFARNLNGHIKSISYYPQRLSNDVLKGLTA